jgi:hypothetical protein
MPMNMPKFSVLQNVALITALACVTNLAQAQQADTAPVSDQTQTQQIKVSDPPPVPSPPQTGSQPPVSSLDNSTSVPDPKPTDAKSAVSQSTPTTQIKNQPQTQTLPPTDSDTPGQPQLDRRTQKVEILHFEDSGSKVDEIRSGGQTRSITVKPKNGLPAYNVRPISPNATSPDAGIGQAGPRTWTIHQF